MKKHRQADVSSVSHIPITDPWIASLTELEHQSG